MELYKVSPALARRALIQAWQQTRNISQVARLYQTTRKTVRKALRKWAEEGEKGFEDRSRRPKSSPRRTPLSLEGAILAERKKTGYGRDRISRLLQERGLEVKPSTIRCVLRRYKISGKYKRYRFRRRHRFYDFDSLYPLEHFQVT